MVFYIPHWLTNIVFLVTCYLAGFEHVQLRRENPVMNIQFFTMFFSLGMIFYIVISTDVSPLWSMIYFALAAGSFALMFYYLRRLPPRKPFE